MKQDHLSYNVRKARIYKDIYRPSFKLSYFLGTLLSVIIHGQSRVGSPSMHEGRRRY
ncbi:MAG TPA: hypothetical protein VKQ52_12195 [Puia sp.]|nr:hypothetical protein [Puia sp.]